MSSRMRWIVLACVLVAALGGGVAWHFASQPYHFLVVDEGKLYRSGTLSDGQLRQVIAEHGIKTVVNLRGLEGDWHDTEKTVCAETGVKLVDLPLPEETPPTPEELRRWLALIDDPAARPILVHCQHGVVRTGMMVAAYEVENKLKTPEQALADMPAFGHRLDRPKREPMREFVRKYVPRWQAATATPTAALDGAARK